jgi:anti-sigma-K factor RskA
MNESFDDLMHLAGEYVLGTLSSPLREEVERRLPSDAALRAAVDEWEQRLLPLTALAEAQQPSAKLWPRIERSLPMPQRVRLAGGWRAWWNSLVFWRWLAAGGFAGVAMLAVLMAGKLVEPGQQPAYIVVLVQPQDKAPGWVVQTNYRNQPGLTLTPLGEVIVPPQKALQFWTKGSDWTGPRSLGLVRPGQSQRVALDKLPPVQPNQLFEITLEPETGSPTGKPSGPVLYIGKAVKVT